MFKIVLICAFSGGSLAKPWFSSPVQALSSLASASASGSSSLFFPSAGNVVDFRNQKSQNLDQDLFKNETDIDDNFGGDEGDQSDDNVFAGLIRQKISKILRKIQFLGSLSSPNDMGNKPDDVEVDFDKEQDDFDKEFNADRDISPSSGNLLNSGYFYEKPENLGKMEKITLQPNGIGVFFMELLGSIVGLAYGAAAQLNLGNKN